MKIKTVGVVGCGLMGGGIAQVVAQAGCETIVREASEELLAKGLGRIEKILAGAVAKGKIEEEETESEDLEPLSYRDDYD